MCLYYVYIYTYIIFITIIIYAIIIIIIYIIIIIIMEFLSTRYWWWQTRQLMLNRLSEKTLPSPNRGEENVKFQNIPQTRWIKHFTVMNGEQAEVKRCLDNSRGFSCSRLDLTFQNSILLQISSYKAAELSDEGPPFSLDYSRNFCITNLNWSTEEREMPASSEKHACGITMNRRQWNKDSYFWISDKLLHCRINLPSFLTKNSHNNLFVTNDLSIYITIIFKIVIA